MRCRRFAAPSLISGAAAKAHIARVMLQSPNDIDARLGDVTLLRYQLDGAARLRDILARRGGALLADEVGLGKTYTALAVARHFRCVEIVAPAALRAMWHEAGARSGIDATFVSAEALSRASPPERGAELIVVDEAHWFRNSTTQRYRQLARRCRAVPVLLLSATPVHNRYSDLTALFALFLGARASHLAPSDIAELVVRRGRPSVVGELSQRAPNVRPTRWWRLTSDANVVAALDRLEAPVPPRDGGLALALLRLTLLRRLSSSDAALRATLRRMLARAVALLDAARGGSYPTARELCSWVVADEAIQLELPGLRAARPNELVSIDALERHIASLRAAIAALDEARDRDRSRAAALTKLLRQFPKARIVAFSQYDATVRALGRALRGVPGIAILSGKGGRIASGQISRSALLQQFDALQRRRAVGPAMRVRLLLTTDLLSEGVNLHNAQVIVHLDIPWTPARLEQRVGRLSRIGSPHDEIHVYGFAPPTLLEERQRQVSRLRAKWETSRRHLGASVLLEHDALVTRQAPDGGAADARDYEALLRLLHDWLGADTPDMRLPFVAQVNIASARTPITLALIGLPHGPGLVVVERKRRITMQPRAVLRVASEFIAALDVRPPDNNTISRTFFRLRRYLAQRRAWDAASGALGRPAASLHARIAQAISRVPRGQRPGALVIAAAIRAQIQRVRSAGDHVLLEERVAALINHARDVEPLRWLERTRAILTAGFTTRRTDENVDEGAYRLIGILIGIDQRGQSRLKILKL
ncbi:MAG: helicase-related protein [Gemmatimonadaceae bacterium]